LPGKTPLASRISINKPLLMSRLIRPEELRSKDTAKLARFLLGKQLARIMPDGDARYQRIVEVEA